MWRGGLLLLIACALASADAIQWLGLYKLNSPTDGDSGALRSFCKAMKAQGIFGVKQFRYCKKFAAGSPGGLGIVSALIEASKQTLTLCRAQFRGFRWNCSVLERVPRLAPELRTLTAEQALVHALSGFVLTTTFANECAKGAISCPCGAYPEWVARKRPEMRFSFSGCHTNLKVGQKMARRFLGAGAPRAAPRRRKSRRRDRRRPRAADSAGRMAQVYGQFARQINAHNYRVGIMATRHSEAVRCKCHGTSASCSVKTCHMVLHRRDAQMLPDPGYIRKSDEDPVDILLNMYDKQKLRKTVFDENGYQGYEERCTDADREAGSNPLASRPKCETYKLVQGLPSSEVLLFHEHSLDYCSVREPGNGSYPGTQDRECLPDWSRDAAKIMSTDSGDRRREILCSVMCCGRGHRNATVTYDGTHPECQARSCRLLQNPFRVDCQPCVLAKSFCN